MFDTALIADRGEIALRILHAGAPCAPGSDGALSEEKVAAEAARIGHPAIVKAAGGVDIHHLRRSIAAREVAHAV